MKHYKAIKISHDSGFWIYDLETDEAVAIYTKDEAWSEREPSILDDGKSDWTRLKESLKQLHARKEENGDPRKDRIW